MAFRPSVDVTRSLKQGPQHPRMRTELIGLLKDSEDIRLFIEVKVILI